MKWLMILFSLYIMVLSVVPCCGEDFCCQEEIISGNGKTAHRNYQQHQSELPCSPLACIGYPAIFIAGFTFVIEVSPGVSSDFGFHYVERPLTDYIVAIWQPPQA